MKVLMGLMAVSITEAYHLLDPGEHRDEYKASNQEWVLLDHPFNCVLILDQSPLPTLSSSLPENILITFSSDMGRL